jgi:hypothetical protein
LEILALRRAPAQRLLESTHLHEEAQQCARANIHKMKTFTQILAIILTLFTVARAADVDESVVAKIVVKSNGELLFDDQKVEMRELERLLTPIKEKRGIVWYRIVPRREGLHPVALEVAKLVNSQRIPIRMFSRSDFAENMDVVGRARQNSQQGARANDRGCRGAFSRRSIAPIASGKVYFEGRGRRRSGRQIIIVSSGRASSKCEFYNWRPDPISQVPEKIDGLEE